MAGARFYNIRTRLQLVIMAGASVGMLVLTIVFVAYSVNLLALKRNQQVQAELGVLAATIGASIIFEDEAAARELLQGLAVDDDILWVNVRKVNAPFSLLEVFNSQYIPFAKESTQSDSLPAVSQEPQFHAITLPPHPSSGPWVERKVDLLIYPVMIDGDLIAQLNTYVSHTSLNNQVKKTIVLAAVVFWVTAAVIFFISRRLQRAITAPIEALSALSKKVTTEGDYTLRAQLVHRDEIGDLAQAFNRMLDQIEQRDLMLEKTVQQRTCELERLADEFRYRAFHDSLTGLPNRALLAEQFVTVAAHANRTQSLFAVFLMDLDNFKNINDTLGHDVGDELLVVIAQRLRHALRDEDLICRLGGDEFLIITENLQIAVDRHAIAKKLFSILADPIQINDKRLNITMSIGCALAPVNGIDLTTLKRAADIAMYAAKEAGKNQFKVFEESMEVTAKHRLMVQNDLRGALKNGDIKLYYQPQVNALTREVYGCEVLVRWRHEKLGLLFPDVFIPYAEESGLVQLVDYYVLDMACRQGREWLNAGQPLVISINLSGLHFRNHDIVAKVKAAITEHDLPACYLGVELTEAVLISDSKIATQVVTELKALGIKISLDDFGVGYSSLNYLRTLPFDVIKLDKSFVHSVLTNRQDQRLTEGIIKLAVGLQLHVVAEGVESQAQMEYLLSIQCYLMQGYYFLPPRDKEEFETWRLQWQNQTQKSGLGVLASLNFRPSKN